MCRVFIIGFFLCTNSQKEAELGREKMGKFHSSVTTLRFRVEMNSFYALNLLIHLHFSSKEIKRRGFVMRNYLDEKLLTIFTRQ